MVQDFEGGRLVEEYSLQEQDASEENNRTGYCRDKRERIREAIDLHDKVTKF